ncbi:MAG: SGNH/GDSL hydrolase family protein [Candidatus Methanofastidiosa archaeon]|nr:SGNH/GDSL hydrolase family protein [Candidatus Methanofastidiosa archaeon]
MRADEWISWNHIKARSGVNWCQEFRDVYNNMTNKPPKELAQLYNTFVKTLVDGGVWTKLEYLNIKTAHTNQNGEAQINWITPTIKNTINGTMTFNAFSGFTGSTNGYIATGIIPSTSTKLLQNSTCYFFYKNKIGAAGKSDGGTIGVNGHMLNASTHLTEGILTYNRVNNISTSADSAGVTTFTGLWILNRTDSSKFDIWHGKTKVITKNKASTGRPDREFYEFVLNDATLTGFSNAEYSLHGLGSGLTDAEITILSDAVDILMTAMNNTIQYDETKWGDSVVLADYTTHKARSAFSEYSFNFSGTRIYITANPTIYSIFPALSYLTIFVNGELNQRVTFSSFTEKEITLPAGSKIITIVTAVNSKPSSTFLGVYPTILKAISTITPIAPASVSDKIVFIGDSIFSGANATYPETQGCSRLFKLENGIDVGCLVWGWATLSEMASDSGKIAITVTHIQNLLSNATGTKKVICNLGTNDHALLGLSAANYGTYYGNLLDAIHSADENIKIWCVSPILRLDGYENSTLDDYRTAVGNVCAARSSYATHIPGKPILSSGDYADTVHPSTTGQKKLKDAIYAVVYP